MTERATRTTLALGAVEAPVALYCTFTDKLPEVTFDSAGPNGGKLWKVPVVVDAEDPEQVAEISPPVDPLAEGVLEVPEELHETPLPVPQTEGRYSEILAEEGTGKEVSRAEIRKGVRTDVGFLDLTEHLAAIAEDTKLDVMRVEGFLPGVQAGDLLQRITGAYWVAPADGSGYTLALTRMAMIRQSQIALVRWTKRTKQSLGLLAPVPEGLLLIEVVWSALARKPRPEVTGITDIGVSDGHLAMAMELIAEMALVPSALDEAEDDALALKRDLREYALTTGEVPPVIRLDNDPPDLTEKLAESIGGAA